MKNIDQPEVRERLLDTGLRVFAIKGYDGATVREMSEQANSNIAAINYYFGDKEGFYKAVKEYARELRREAMNSTWNLMDEDPWAALHCQIETLLNDTYDKTMFLVNWLFMRELMDSDSQDAEESQERREVPTPYEVRMTKLMSALLGDAATQANISLLRYTYHSLCLFLPIHKKFDEKYLRGQGRFNVNGVVDKEALTEFIFNAVRRTAEDMKNKEQR